MAGVISSGVIVSVYSAVMVMSMWTLKVSAGLLLLPIIGMLTALLAIIPGLVISRLFEFSSPQTGSFTCGAMLSNIGLTLGGFLSYSLLGEAGLSYSIVYSSFSMPFYFVVCFYVASLFAEERRHGIMENLKLSFMRPSGFIPILSMAMGFALNVMGFERPHLLGTVNQVFAYMTSFFLLFASGLTFDFRMIRVYRKEALSMFPIKFLYNPLMGMGLVYLLKGKMNDPLLTKVVFIESVTPVAVFALLLPQFFKLDQDLVNATWVFTTGVFILMIPLIMLVLDLL
jgi:predicted permease